jgi:hypothetical protein
VATGEDYGYQTQRRHRVADCYIVWTPVGVGRAQADWWDASYPITACHRFESVLTMHKDAAHLSGVFDSTCVYLED